MAEAVVPTGSSVTVIVLDTLRAEAFDAQMMQSLPTLRGLLRESYVFSRAYAPSHWTLPSHASLFTGLMPSEIGAHPPNFRLLDDVRTIAEVYRDRAYFTACVTCNPYLSDIFGMTRGFDVVWSNSSLWTNGLDRGYKLLSRVFPSDGNHLPTSVWTLPEKVGAILRSTPRSDNGASEALSYARRLVRARQNSTFLLLNLMEAHNPYHGRGAFSRWKHRVHHADIFGDWVKFVWGVMGGRLKISERKQHVLEQVYWENVRYLDSRLESFISALPARFLDEGFVIVLSDHGQLLGEKGKIDHVSGLSEELIRVPLSIRPPGGNGGGRVDLPVDLSMVFHLLRSIANGDPSPLESWLEFIRKQDGAFSEAHGGLVPHVWRLVGHDPIHRGDQIDFKRREDYPALACVGGRWKLICHLGRRQDELYDLQNDPAEDVNSVTQNPNVLEELHRKLADRFVGTSTGRALPAYKDRLPARAKRVIAETVLQETFEESTNPALLWTGGKDSTLLLFLILDITRETDRVPPPMVFVDHGQHFDETRAFMDDLVEREHLRTIIARNDDLSTASREAPDAVRLKSLDAENQEEALRIGFSGSVVPLDLNTAVGNHLLKTVALKQTINEHGFDYVITGIRWDENPARSAEVFFSPREDPAHIRVHPILPWTEREVWNYTLHEGLPIHPLYEQGYRSFDGVRDSKPTSTKPAWEQDLEATKERSGRAQDKEEIMERLRALGYF